MTAAVIGTNRAVVNRLTKTTRLKERREGGRGGEWRLTGSREQQDRRLISLTMEMGRHRGPGQTKG